MLKNLFVGAAPAARAPEGERIYAIGDIHGCADALDRLMALICEDEAAGALANRLIFLGDYVDRGPDSRGVVERLIAIGKERPGTVFLKGNHEAAMLDFLAAPVSGGDWLHWGGAETLHSYGVDNVWRRPPEDLAAALGARLPRAHLNFLRNLSLSECRGDYFFVHAGVKPGVPLDAQEEDDLLWIREEFHDAPAPARPDKVVVHGHHPVRKPVDAGWRIDIDTGACYGGKLTAAVLEGEKRRFLSA